MILTTQQKAALKTAIEANPTWNAFPHNDDGNFDLAVALNQPATPTFQVWRSLVSTDEIMLNGFDWTRVDNLTAGKARIWEWMTQLGRIRPDQANVRAGVEACFSASADAPNRQAVYDHCVRPATFFEKVFTTGTGATPNSNGVGPGVAVIEGPVNGDILREVRG